MCPDDDSFFYNEYDCDYGCIDISDFNDADVEVFDLIKSMGGE